MKKYFTLALALLTLVSFSQETLSYEYLNVNNVKALISPVGNQFNDFSGSSCFQIPSDSSTCSIFNSSLWIGGKDANNQLKFAGEQYRQRGRDFFPGPLVASGSDIGTVSDSVSQSWNRIWRMTREEINQFIICYNNPSYPLYEIPNSILEWPANGDTEISQASILAPYYDNNNDGFYNPIDGDYPMIKGDECLFFIFNDKADLHTESGGTPIGIEVHGMAYGFGCSESESFDNTIFINYKIINRSTYTLYETYIGSFTDFDIGFPNDDYIGCNVEKGAFFGYNGDDFDETANGINGYGEFPPAQAVVILKGAPIDPDGIDNTHSFDTINGNLVLNCEIGDILNGNINGTNFGDGIVDNERYGMTGFAYFNNFGTGANPNTVFPGNATDYYGYMNGHWLDYTHFCYGGTGHYSGGANPEIPTNFMFPGNPTSDPCGWGQDGNPQQGWSEVTEANSPGDRNGLGVSGPFTFLPGEELEFEIAYVYARAGYGTTETTLEKLFACIDTVKNGYMNDITPCGTSFIYNEIPVTTINSTFNTSIYPNPTNNTLHVEFSKVSNYQIKILDIQGKVFLTEITNNKTHVFDLSSLAEGVYFVKISDGKSIETNKLVILR
ncbi:MAG: T9SS type A sorting domain-containing protein [Bacteroidales bacterium]|nr:T9SS type A sorting domain-containing protein [Bacteroidales bacterium]